MTDGAVAAARAYYRALDEHDYDALAALLAPEFVHDRPDLILEGRGRFVAFMREERPQKETEHRIDAVYRAAGSDDDSAAGLTDCDSTDDQPTNVAARGRLLTAGGDRITGFVDVVSVSDGEIRRIKTYTD